MDKTKTPTSLYSGSDNVVTHRQSTTYTTSQVIQPSANTTRIGFDRSPEERSTVSTAHIVPSHLNETASPLRETHHSHLGGYDRLAAKQASLAKDLAERDAFNRSHGSHPAPGGAQNLHYQTVESQLVMVSVQFMYVFNLVIFFKEFR